MAQDQQLERSALGAISTPVVVVRPDGKIAETNAAARRRFGISDDQAAIASLIPDFATDKWRSIWTDLVRRKTLRLQASVGEPAGTLSEASVVADYWDSELGPRMLLQVHSGANRESLPGWGQTESIRHSIMESSLDTILLIDPQARVQFINRTVEGVRRDEVVGTSIYQHVSDEYHDRMRDCFQGVIESGNPGHYQVVYELVDGTSITYECRVAPVRSGEEITALTIFARDVTQRVRADQALRESERSLARAQKIARIGSWEYDIANARPSGSAELRRLLGVQDANRFDTLERFVEGMIHPEDRELIRQSYLASLAKNETESIEFRVLRPSDGTVCHVRAEAELVCDKSGVPTKIIGTLQDITDRKQAELALREMESQLAHVSRLSTMGEMVAGIAHEINQPLSAIANFAQACKTTVGESGHRYEVPVETWLGNINEQAVRCGDIIRRLRNFVSKSGHDRETVGLNRVIRDSIALLRSDVRRGAIAIRCNLPQAEPWVNIDQVELQQVVVNLLCNACDAADENSQPDVCLDVKVDGDEVCLVIEDNGRGIAEPERYRLFDPFFTTKPDGMGMGLAISKSIIEAHDGTLRYDPPSPSARRGGPELADRDGDGFAGARFSIVLPRAEADLD